MSPNLFLERTFDEPWTRDDVLDGGREASWCFEVHRVRWSGSFLAADGRAMICTFTAPDLESGRLAMRDAEMDLSLFWAGTVHGSPGRIAPNVVVERWFAAPTRYEDIKALSEAKAWCLDTYNVKYSHTFLSTDGKRMLCFYSAPDAEAVRNVQREAGAPMAAVWAGSSIVPPEA